MSIARLAARLKTAGFSRLSLQFAPQIPGTPFAIRGETKEERMAGMNRWVNRRMIEEAMDAHELGVSPDEFAHRQAVEGSGTPVALGAGLGGAAGYSLASKYPEHAVTKHLGKGPGGAPLTAALLGTLIGAGTGYGYHQVTKDRRLRDAYEAYTGAAIEHMRYPRPVSALPQKRQDEGSAAALTPTLLHTAPSVL